MSDSYCCPQCFGDVGLEDEAFPYLEAQVGCCNFCEETDVSILEPSKLVEYIQPLIDSYKKSEDGEPLVNLLKKDWMLFENTKLSSKRAGELLDCILAQNGIGQEKFIVLNEYEEEHLVRWGAFKQEIMHVNRWFLGETLDLDRLENLLGLLLAKKLPDEWYRARLQDKDSCYFIQDMGAPPHRLSSHGRANPAGIPYLYLGSEPETALAEVRPINNQKVSVAKFQLTRLDRIIDLRNPRKRVSPFTLQDSDKISALRAELPFLEQLGKELSCSVLPFGAAVDYTPSQYLCEFIKNKGFDGVVYQSSVSSGFNLALFDATKAVGRNVEERIAKISASFDG